MSQLWMPRGDVALANAVLEGPFTKSGPIKDSCNGSRFEDLHDKHLSMPTPHPRRGPESLSP